MKSVYVSGVGMTKFGKDPRPLADIVCDAARQALVASKTQEVEALYIGTMNPEEFTGDSNIASQMADALGLTGIPAVRIETASSAGAAAIQAGFQAIASGYYRRVLVLGGEKMTHLGTSAITRVLAEVIDQEERRCGATMPALAAMIAEKYRQTFRLSQSRLQNILCSVALKNHDNGSRNSLAQFQQSITREAYFLSKLVATPLRLYDCSPITDGAAAVVLTSEKTDVRLSGIGQGTGPLSLRARDTFTSFPATRIAAVRAYQMAETSPQGIDFAEVHDAFTPFEIITTEDLGFFPPGKGGQAVIAGKTAFEGSLPVNPSGGLKARGHPVGASGLAQVVEVVKTLRGQTGSKRQFKRGLTQSTGGLGTNNFVTILELSDSHVAQHPGLPFSPPPPASRRMGTPPAAISEEGRIETFTTLHVTPEGFLPPLVLALIRDSNGRLLMAQGDDSTQMKIGREVYLKRTNDLYLFTPKSRFQKVHEYMRRLLRRGATPIVKDQPPADHPL
ncbi:MAG: thiolase C-terminal domain-containing protein [Candidatus Binatia bacterium]